LQSQASRAWICNPSFFDSSEREMRREMHEKADPQRIRQEIGRIGKAHRKPSFLSFEWGSWLFRVIDELVERNLSGSTRNV